MTKEKRHYSHLTNTSKICIIKCCNIFIKCFTNLFSLIDLCDEESSIDLILLTLNCRTLSNWGEIFLVPYSCVSFSCCILLQKKILITLRFLLNSCGETKFVKSSNLLSLNIKSTNSVHTSLGIC